MNEFQAVQKAVGKVLDDVNDAFQSGDISAPTALLFHLMLVARSMKTQYKHPATKIVSEACRFMGFNYEILEEQVDARIYEYVQLENLENFLKEDGHND